MALDSKDKYLEYAKANKEKFIASIIKGKKISKNKDAIFMAGSSGAEKTEVALGLSENYANHVVIDADYFREQFHDYNGKNSSEFQKASSWLVEQAFKFVIQNGYSFILDATFAILSAEKNIIRTEKSGFTTTIFYVYQDPNIAWEFTKEREITEGRHVPKQTFIDTYFQARENIEKIKERHPDVTLHIIVKDYQNNVSEVHYSADNIQLVISEQYNKQELEDILND